MNIPKTFLLIFFILIQIKVYSQQTPANEQKEIIILFGAVAHIGNGKIIENAAIGFENGKITFVTDAATIKLNNNEARIIDVTGKHVYPGLIAPNTFIGLNEVDEVRATKDYKETGTLNPNVRSIIAYNTDSRIIPTIRSNGILLAQVVPQGGRISGSSSIVELDAWNWEDAAYKTGEGIHLNWPAMSNRQGGHPHVAIKTPNNWEKQIKSIKQLFDQAWAYAVVKMHEKTNLKLEAMRGLFDSSATLYIHVNNVKDIIMAVNFTIEYNIKAVIVGGKDSWMVADILKENNIPVILTSPHTLPARQDEDIDLPYKTPYLLQQAGVLYCLSLSGSWEQRNLMFIAGTAAAYGLTKEEALMSVTSNTAKVLGIDKTIGTLENGKDATLIISTGDILDMRTSNIELAFIKGKQIDLDNKQKALYRKFKTKYQTFPKF